MVDSFHEFEKMKTLPGGVGIAVTRVNGEDIIHGAALGEVLSNALEEEAKYHKASFDRNAVNRILELAKANKIQIHFAVVSLEGSFPKFAGCTVEFPTVFTKWVNDGFRYYPAIYAEDFYVSSDISAEFKNQTKTDSNPKGIGLGTQFLNYRDICSTGHIASQQ